MIIKKSSKENLSIELSKKEWIHIGQSKGWLKAASFKNTIKLLINKLENLIDYVSQPNFPDDPKQFKNIIQNFINQNKSIIEKLDQNEIKEASLKLSDVLDPFSPLSPLNPASPLSPLNPASPQNMINQETSEETATRDAKYKLYKIEKEIDHLIDLKKQLFNQPWTTDFMNSSGEITQIELNNKQLWEGNSEVTFSFSSKQGKYKSPYHAIKAFLEISQTFYEKIELLKQKIINLESSKKINQKDVDKILDEFSMCNAYTLNSKGTNAGEFDSLLNYVEKILTKKSNIPMNVGLTFAIISALLYKALRSVNKKSLIRNLNAVLDKLKSMINKYE